MKQDEMTNVVILTKYYRIEGDIALMPGGRLTDYMGTSNEFVAVIKATVFDLAKDRKMLSGRFLNIRRNSIEVILPSEAVDHDSI